MFFSSTAAAAPLQQHSSSGSGDVELLFLVPAPQMKKMEHWGGTFFRDSYAYYALWIVLHIADGGTEEAAAAQQQHSSSNTAAVVAATSRLRTKRTSVDAPVSLLFSFLRFRPIWKGLARTHREVFSNHCCFTVPLNTPRLHTR